MSLDGFGEVLGKLQGVMILSIPIFGFIYKEAFLFFVPLVIFIILGFGYVKKKILEGYDEDSITRVIFSIGRWTFFLWILEFSIYMLIKFSLPV